MEYGWPPAHDALVADANLAEIDFEDFRNEDLAYAFSCEVTSPQAKHTSKATSSLPKVMRNTLFH
jgi:hypothetical protein